MFYTCLLRKGIVYIPTYGKTEGGGPYRAVEPVSVVAVSNSEALRHALAETMARGNPAVANVSRANFPEPVVLKYAGVKSWSTFARDASSWHINETNGLYEIVGTHDSPYGGWQEDPDQRITFPAGAGANAVIERMIEILQAFVRR